MLTYIRFSSCRCRKLEYFNRLEKVTFKLSQARDARLFSWVIDTVTYS